MELNLIGYDSDSVYEAKEDYRMQRIARYNVVDKIRVDKNKQETIIRKTSNDREAHVYLIHNEKVYYKVYRELSEFNGYGEVRYLGIGLEPPLSVKDKLQKLKKKGQIKGVAKVGTSYFKEGMKCCYCDLKLDKFICTREHIIPKHKGGKVIYPCCTYCNGEKGGMTLSIYIIHLKSLDFGFNQAYKMINDIKILNAEKLLSIYGN